MSASADEQCGCGCGVPSRDAFLPASDAGVPEATGASGESVHLIEQVVIPAGRFRMGDSSGDENRGDGETPQHDVALAEFSIDATTVTNADFGRFVAATGYRTDAETFGFSAVFHLAL